MQGIEVGMQGIRVGMQEISGEWVKSGWECREWGVGIRGIRVGMQGIREIICENLCVYSFG